MTRKPEPGQPLPAITLPTLGGGEVTLGTPGGGHDWQAVIVYRGKHCPLCHKYAETLEAALPKFHEAGVEVVWVSGDPETRAQAFKADTGTSAPLAYGLSLEQMHTLGLYVSDPRSEQETDRPFPEPGLFVVNAEGVLQIVDISNAPFARPDLAKLAAGLAFVREKDYPIRGRRAA